MASTLLKALACLLALSTFYCVFLVMRKHGSLKTAVRFDGEVVGYTSNGGGGGKRATKRLQVAYRNEAGGERTFTAPGPASNPPSHAIGEKVTVLRRGDGVEEVLSFQTLYFGHWIWFCMGLACAGAFLWPHVLERIYGDLPNGAPAAQGHRFGSEKKPLRR